MTTAATGSNLVVEIIGTKLSRTEPWINLATGSKPEEKVDGTKLSLTEPLINLETD